MESLKIVEHMLSKSDNQPLHNTDNEYNPLHIACQKSNTEITRNLLSHSPKLLLLQAGKEKLSPLHIACSNGNIEMVQLILEQIYTLIQSGNYPSLSLDFTDHLGHTPFYYACARGAIEIVKLLIEFQAKPSCKVTLNVNSAEPYQSTPLHAAVQSGNTEVLKMLLHVKGINLNAKGRPAEKTQIYCLDILEKTLHGRVVPVNVGVDQKEVCTAVTTDAMSIQSNTPKPTSPTSRSSAFYISLSSTGDTLPAVSEDCTSSATCDKDKSGRSKKRTGTLGRFNWKPRRRTTSDTNLGDTKNPMVTGPRSCDATICVATTNQPGNTSIELNESSGYKSYDQLLVTPLTEACAYGNAEIVNLLLKYGVKDDDGFACRISISHPDLAWSVLAHHCIIVEEGGEEKELAGVTDTTARLQLQWGSKNLSELDGSWFSNTSEYFPSQRQKEEDAGDTGSDSSRMRLPQTQLLCSSNIAKYNSNIVAVHLEQNHLQSIPLEIFCLPNVEEINLSHNRCTELPEDVGGWKCVHLKKLYLSHNLFVNLPSSVWVLPALRKLVATHNRLAALLKDNEKKFKEETLSKSLEHVDFSNNHLIELPSFLFQLPSLKQAFLGHNKLISLPDTVWSSTTIKELTINHNCLKCLPKSGTIDSDSTYKLPDVLQQFEVAPQGIIEVRPRLNSSLNTSNQSQTSVDQTRPFAIKQEVLLPAAGVDSREYSSLTKLNIADNKLEIFPVGLPCFVPNLTELDVSNNSFKDIDIQYIPKFIVKFTAQNCGIERFGNVFTQTLHAKVVKHCLHKKTFGYPCQHRKHSQLPNLTNLKLSGNRLRYFQLLYREPLESDDEEPIEKDQKFDPNKTSVDLLYPALEVLELSGNNLHGEFNPNIGHQSRLKQIKLDKNQELQKIPMEFAYLKRTRQFTELQMNDLPNLIEPPPEYQNKEIKLNHLLTYMTSRLKE